MGIAVLILPAGPAETLTTLSSFLVVAREDDHAVVLDVGDVVVDRRVTAVTRPDLETLLAHTDDEWVTIVHAGDQFEPGAFDAIADYLSRVEVDVIYTDHRVLGEGTMLKPRWQPRLLEQSPYLGRLVVVRRELAVATAASWKGEWDHHLRVTAMARRVGHVPVVAVAIDPSGIETAGGSPMALVRSHLRRTGEDAVVSRRPDGSLRVRATVPPDHIVSIIIPTKGSARTIRGETIVLAENLIHSLAATTHTAWEAILVASDGSDPAMIAHLASLTDRVRTVSVDGPFNFSASINAGAVEARGDSLLLLNDDTEVIDGDWLTQMLGVLLRPGVGAVGARLLFEDHRIQHVGVVCPPWRLPFHPRMFEPDHEVWDLRQDVEYLAVTGACLLTRRSDFFDIGGFTEELPLNFNDVDYCLKLVLTGHRIVCVNDATLLHFESSTRTAQILEGERAAYHDWLQVTLTDPHTAMWDGVGSGTSDRPPSG